MNTDSVQIAEFFIGKSLSFVRSANNIKDEDLSFKLLDRAQEYTKIGKYILRNQADKKGVLIIEDFDVKFEAYFDMFLYRN